MSIRTRRSSFPDTARPRAGAGRRDLAAWPRPTVPRLPGWLAYRAARLLAPNPAYRRLARWLEPPGLRGRLFAAAEKSAKGGMFGCRMCGQCALPATGYACPMTCPKQLRNGPCGGVGADGSCEVYPAMRCVWVVAYERAERHGHGADLSLLQRPIDHRRWGESSWVSYWQGRDDGLWAAQDEAGGRPPVWRPPAAAAGNPPAAAAGPPPAAIAGRR